MNGYSTAKYSSIQVDDKTIGLLASSEAELIRADAAISSSHFRNAICRQILRVEALSSVVVDGFRPEYSDLAQLELAQLNRDILSDDPDSMLRFARKRDLQDCLGAIVAYQYMKTVEWISDNVHEKTTFDEEIFDTIHNLYNEEAIEEISQAYDDQIGLSIIDFSESKLFELRHQRHKRELVKEYLHFLNSDLLTASAQAEISHAYIQTLKPYGGKLDGIERLFSHIVFYRRGILTSSVAPLAIGPCASIEQHAKSIASNMNALAIPELGDIPKHPRFEHCAYSTKISARVMQLCRKELETLWLRDRPDGGGTKKGAAYDLLFAAFLSYPFLTVNSAAKLIDKSFSTTNNAMQSLLSKGIVADYGHFGKNRVFCMPELLSFFSELLSKMSGISVLNRDKLLNEYEQSIRENFD